MKNMWRRNKQLKAFVKIRVVKLLHVEIMQKKHYFQERWNNVNFKSGNYIDKQIKNKKHKKNQLQICTNEKQNLFFYL